jgi:predicted phage terminase large subunit-like protein
VNDYKNNKNWKILEKAIIENWEITWDYFTHEDLEKIKAQQGEIAFNQNYLLIPFSWGDTLVKRSQIKYWVHQGKFDRISIWVDPAISEKTRSDAFAITVTWSVWESFYVIEWIELNGEEKDPIRAVQTIIQLYRKYNANIVRVETVAFQQVISKLLKNEWVAVEEIKPHKDKITRLLEWQYLFEQGKVYFHPEQTEKLVNQLLDFPNVLHDDLVDSFVYSLKTYKKTLFVM